LTVFLWPEARDMGEIMAGTQKNRGERKKSLFYRSIYFGIVKKI
jgi:hypothetical protein